jgi:hypothetical protein
LQYRFLSNHEWEYLDRIDVRAIFSRKNGERVAQNLLFTRFIAKYPHKTRKNTHKKDGMILADRKCASVCAKEHAMKKKLMIAAFFSAATILFARGVSDTVTVEGKLVITDSIPTIQGNGKTWVLPPGPFYQLAWENGVKTGDAIKAEGYERECPAELGRPDALAIMPTKAWVNGKEVDLSTVRRPMMGRGLGRGYGVCGGSRDGRDFDCPGRGDGRGRRGR